MLITAGLLKTPHNHLAIGNLFRLVNLGSPFPGPVDALLPAPTLIVESGGQEMGMRIAG